MALDEDEKPQTEIENIHLTIRFTVSMFRVSLIPNLYTFRCTWAKSRTWPPV
jgi:hypothetical protein